MNVNRIKSAKMEHVLIQNLANQDVTVLKEKYATKTDALHCLQLAPMMEIVLKTNIVTMAIVRTADTTFSAPKESIVDGTDVLIMHVANP